MKIPSRVAPFIILALYSTVANSSRFSPALMPALSVTAFAAMFLALWLLRRKEGSLSALGQAMLLFMALNAAGFTVLAESVGRFLQVYLTGTLFLLFLACVFLPALFAGRYFTEHFARKNVPEAVWESPPFKAVNRNMTYGWSAIFGVGVFLAAVPVLAGWTGPGNGTGAPLALKLLFQVALPLLLVLLAGVPFTRKYPKYYLKKLGIELPERDTAPVGGEEKKMTGEWKVVALNGSPKGALGNTSRMVNMVGEALLPHGVRLQEIFLAEHHIEYCMGCAYCLEKARCWRQDDHAGLVDAVKDADGLIFASPVYFGHVTAQMKTFIDRALSHGHKLPTDWKPGLAVSVSGGRGESETGRYLGRVMHPFGFFPVGVFTAIAVRPGDFTGLEHVRQRASDLARDLAVAIKEKRRYPVTDEDFSSYLFMRELVAENRDFMPGDYEYWQKKGLLSGFTAYSGQSVENFPFDPEERAEWIREMIREEAAKTGGGAKRKATGGPGKYSGLSCRELLENMPRGFKPEVAGDLAATYQFQFSGPETFDAYLEIADGKCLFHEGRAGRPDITILAPSDVWLSIARGELNGQSAFMSGKFKVQGDMGLMMRMKNIFG